MPGRRNDHRVGQPVALAAIPDLAPDDFRAFILGRTEDGWRIAALFGAPVGESGAVRLFAVLAEDEPGHLALISTLPRQGEFPALTPDCVQAHLFEREIAECWGLRPIGHPWLKPVRFHKPFAGPALFDRSPRVGVMDFYRVEGESVHEVAVGPVHAGVIEPGHFRFQCHGENVFNLEISLGYQHRGVETAIPKLPRSRVLAMLEAVAGDTSIGHAWAWCKNIEALSGTGISAGAEALRAIMLELERLANHTGDLGMLAGDVGFLPTLSYCGRLRGDYLNLSGMICGSRFGRTMLVPGGVRHGLEQDIRQPFIDKLKSTTRDVRGACDLMFESSMVMERFEGTGALTGGDARQLGMVGPAARACGVNMDVRRNFPDGVHRKIRPGVVTHPAGDVFSRAFVRYGEVLRSAEFIDEAVYGLTSAHGGELQVPVGELAASSLCVSLVEGWRGAICHVCLTDAKGAIAWYKIVDPSFHNWSGLAHALRDQQISDFPLCNKSFNLSYCGFDL